MGRTTLKGGFINPEKTRGQKTTTAAPTADVPARPRRDVVDFDGVYTPAYKLTVLIGKEGLRCVPKEPISHPDKFRKAFPIRTKGPKYERMRGNLTYIEH